MTLLEKNAARSIINVSWKYHHIMVVQLKGV